MTKNPTDLKCKQMADSAQGFVLRASQLLKQESGTAIRIGDGARIGSTVFRRSIIITLYKKLSSVRVHNILKSCMTWLLHTRTHSSHSYRHKTYPRSSQLKIPAWNKARLPRLHPYLGSWTGFGSGGALTCFVLSCQVDTD